MMHDTRDVPFSYKGAVTIVASVTGEFCPACAESLLDMAESRRVGAQFGHFIEEVDAHLLTALKAN
ncbi:type II toxin-antitoxin system MqsA family antitoxin [Rugamonas sp. CCM 8940]